MEKTENSLRMSNIAGNILSISHIFKLKQSPFFLIELQTKSGSCYIVVRRQQQLSWTSRLEPGISIEVTNLRRTILYKDFDDVFETSQSSIFIKKENNLEKISSTEDLISYAGTITNVDNREIGIFEVDGKFRLVLSYMVDVTVEFSTNSPTSQLWLEIGDKFTIYNCHYVEENETISFIACAKSFIRVYKTFDRDYSWFATKNHILHCIHTFNLGMKFLDWLCHLRNNLSSLRKPEINGNEWESIVKNFFDKLILENENSLLQKNPRSLPREFLQHSSKCVLLENFKEPFSLISLQDLICEVPTNVTSDCFWQYSTHFSQEKHFLIGFLHQSDTGGYLKFEDRDGNICDITISHHESSDSLFKAGPVVLTKFLQISEYFQIEDPLAKQYLLASERDFICLGSRTSALTVSSKTDNIFKLDIILKSAINFQPMHGGKSVNPYFFALCRISQVASHPENVIALSHVISKVLVVFIGKIAKAFPYLKEGTSITGSITTDLYDPLDFKRKKAFGWLPKLKEYFGTNEVIHIPKYFVLQSISLADIPSTIRNPKSGGLFNFENLVSLEGWIKKRVMVNAKFHKNTRLKHKMISAHIGIPGRKNICVLIEDPYTKTTNWVYLDFSIVAMPLYPLALLPNSKVLLKWLKPSNANKQDYLRSTPVTSIEILEYKKEVDEVQNVQQDAFTSLKKAKTLPGGTALQICCSVSSVLKIVFKTKCPSCNCQMINGCCSFVGCHSIEDGICASFAQIIIDDGTGIASLFINTPENLRVLLNIPKEAWESIHDHCSKVLNGQVVYSVYQTSQQSGLWRILDEFSKSPKIVRPVLINARIFAKSSSKDDRLELYCIDLKNFYPNMYSD